MADLREARMSDIAPIAAAMRPMDRLECAVFGRTPTQALRIGLVGSSWVRAVEIDGEPHGLVGVATVDLMAGVGRPWMLGTEKLARERRAWARLGPEVIGGMTNSYATLENWVAQCNLVSRAWLRRLGFREDAEPVLVGSTPMLRFWMTR